MTTKRFVHTIAMLSATFLYGYIAGVAHPGLWYPLVIGIPLGGLFYRFAGGAQ